MKKLNFEKLSNQDLFGSFMSKKLDSLVTSSLHGGEGDKTSTALCKTEESSSDRDNEKDQEHLSDSRCSGY
jgi:hypothetical protein